MGRYFDKLIESYGSDADTKPAQIPWMPEVAPTENLSDEGAAPSFDASATRPVVAAKPFPDPTPSDAPPITPAAEAPAPAIMPIEAAFDGEEPVTAPVSQATLPSPLSGDAASADQASPETAVAVIHQSDVHETHLHLTETHLHQHTDQPKLMDRAQPDPAPPPAPDGPMQVVPDPVSDHDRSQELAALEAHLARSLANLHNPAAAHPPAPLPSAITPADFEPDGSQIRMPIESETIHETTREIVREIHHHHHEIRATEPQRPAPQSAADASRIGPIRFASVWDSGGRAQ